MEHVLRSEQQTAPSALGGMNMKKLLAGAALLLFGMGVAQAQQGQQKTAQERAEKRTERMVKELALNAEQTEKVGNINIRYAEKNEVIRAQRQAMAKANKSKSAELREAQMEEFKAVLTSEQYEKLVAKQEAMKERHKEKRMEKQMEMRGPKND
ncbi:MAG: hypothetical protein KF843_09745 [Flavobacteriales bacterium]|nr:hypothetical protein [Flavobacteriales bacterium]